MTNEKIDGYDWLSVAPDFTDLERDANHQRLDLSHRMSVESKKRYMACSMVGRAEKLYLVENPALMVYRFETEGVAYRRRPEIYTRADSGKRKNKLLSEQVEELKFN